VLAERQRPEVRATGAQGFDRFSRGSDRQRGSAVSSQQANRGGPKCWKCNRWGHFQKDCKQGNSSGTVAVISTVGDQSAKHVGQQVTKVEAGSDQTTRSNEHKGLMIDSQHKREVVESNMCAESLTGSKHKSEVMGSLVKRRGPRCPRRQTRQGTKGKQMVGMVESPSNPPLWVKLDFKTTQIPSLVDTGAQFSGIRKDVVQSLVDLGLNVKRSECKLSCHLANGLSCEIREMVQLHFLLGIFPWTHQFKILQEGPFVIKLDLDFLGHSQMVVDLAKREYYFGFAPELYVWGKMK